VPAKPMVAFGRNQRRTIIGICNFLQKSKVVMDRNPNHDQCSFHWSFCRALILLLLSLFCLNVAVILTIGSYEVRFGFIHLTAHGLFKPILMMNGCFIIALMICGAARKLHDGIPNFTDGKYGSPVLFRASLISAVILLVLVIYYPATGIDIHHNEWTQKHISAGINSLRSTWQFFVHGDPTGFYRPLGFISLWLDYQLFGSAFAGYYVQNIALHIINSLLVAGLALNLGYGNSPSAQSAR
jgi:hypothetical protein